MFQVEWSDDSLLNDLCQIYLDHPSRRKETTYASDRIEKLLSSSADAAGVNISIEGLRKLICDPLEVVYAIDGMEVEIQTVRWVRK
jgi:hypothetical protein